MTTTNVDLLVLELVEVDTLADRLQRGTIPAEEAPKLAHQMAEALEAAHEKGVIHRDLKPANIKVTLDGTKDEDFVLGAPPKVVWIRIGPLRACPEPTRWVG